MDCAAALFEPRVPSWTDVRALRDFLATQTRRAAAHLRCRATLGRASRADYAGSRRGGYGVYHDKLSSLPAYALMIGVCCHDTQEQTRRRHRGAKGIGFAIAELAAADGADVVVASSSEANVNAAVDVYRI